MMKTKYFLLMIIVAGALSTAAHRAVTAGELVGLWKYRISDVPPEYEWGFFSFEQKDSKTIGFVGDTEKQEMKDLTIKQDSVIFGMDFQGGSIKYSLLQKGDTLTGVVSSQYGDFPVTAVKEAKK